jgi:uncharacterized phiE125 gp8 family phage protein
MSYPFSSLGPYGNQSYLGQYGALDAYGTLTLSETSPAQTFTEPLTLSEVRDYLRIPEVSPADQAEDDTLSSLITAAREQAEILQGRDLVRKQWDLNYDYWPSYRVELRPPVVSIDLVKYKDFNGNETEMVENTDFIADLKKQPAVILPPWNNTWPSFTPWPTSAILIRFTAGYLNTDPFWSDAGARVKTGMKLLISHWWENRLPIEKGAAAIVEYPYAITSNLSFGQVPRAR